MIQLTRHATISCSLLLGACALAICGSEVSAQNSAHPDAKPVLPENPYLSYRDPWRWDVRSQLFLSSGYILADNPDTPGLSHNETVISTRWTPREIELVFPVVREGSFYWSPNKEVEVSIRFDDVNVGKDVKYLELGVDYPVAENSAPIQQKFVDGTFAEYTHWKSGDIRGDYRQLHLKHDSHIVSADTVFNDKLARELPWPDAWAPEANAYLTPIVETVGAPVAPDAEETIDTLVKFWIGEDTDPKSGPQLDVVKFLTGKVIEYITVRGQATEYSARSTAGGFAWKDYDNNRPSTVVSANTWGGFIARPADVIAREPQGSRFDLATLLTSVLRSVGVPARTVICVNELEDDPLLNAVAMVEFAMHDPERDLTFWVPIDVDRVRLTGGRSSQYQRKWIYFGSHDELSHMIPIAYYIHPPARYEAYHLPLLYGIRSAGEGRLPEYMIQGLLVDPIVTPATGRDRPRREE